VLKDMDEISSPQHPQGGGVSIDNSIVTFIRSYGHGYVSLTLAIIALTLALNNSILLVIIFIATSICAAKKTVFFLRMARVFFGLFSSLGIALFFNGYLLAEFDLLFRLDVVLLYFLLYELLFFSNFIVCSLLLKPTTSLQHFSDG
jgi:hypothetical protein